jgi:hypothetical protein
MSKSIKKHPDKSPQRRREEKQISFLASITTDQAQLDKLLEGSTPEMRKAMMDRLTPHLPFVPREEVTQDCPHCGLRRGSIIAHECLVN